MIRFASPVIRNAADLSLALDTLESLNRLQGMEQNDPEGSQAEIEQYRSRRMAIRFAILDYMQEVQK